MSINFNPETGAKAINVTLVGEGPICRPDVDGSPHGSAGRSHKHSVQNDASVQLQDAISLYGVELVGGALDKRIDDTQASLREGVVLLGQACVRMSDLLFTKRSPLQSVFADEVEEFLADAELDCETSTAIAGQFGPVSADFLVRGRTTTSAVMTLFSRMPTAAHPAANEVFRKVHDLYAAGRPEQRVTLLDDTVDVSRVYRDEDLRRIEAYSAILPFSDRGTDRALLAA